MSQGNSTVSLGVGIDTARYGHHVSFLDEQKRTAAKSFHFTESAAGYQQLQAALMKLAQNHPGVHFHIRLDAAGQYAENLLQWLYRLPLSTTISVGQPARNKAYRQVHFDKRQADPVESLACARFAIVERPAAAHSTASNEGPIAAELIRQKVRALRQEQAAFASLTDLVEQAWQALPDGPSKRPRTILGIGLQTSAALVAKIVSIERFATPTALIGYFGIFPEEVDVSGTDRHGKPKHGTEIHMSRKGNDLVRRLLYTAAQTAVLWNPPVKALFARLRAQGKDYHVCLGHCMAKLLRQVFALWTKDCDFDPAFESRPKVANESVANESVANESVANEPVANESAANESAANEPVANEATANASTPHDPVGHQP